MKEENDFGDVVIATGTDATAINYKAGQVLPPAGGAWWDQPLPSFAPKQKFVIGMGADPHKFAPTLESLESQLEFLEGMAFELRKQLNELKEHNKKYPKRKLNKNLDIK